MRASRLWIGLDSLLCGNDGDNKLLKNRILLIYPPVTRPSEPPAGIARLAGSLRGSGVHVDVWDANLEGLLSAIMDPPGADDTWTRRATRDREGHIAGLRSGLAFVHSDTYRRAIGDLQRLLATISIHHKGWRPSLTDCSHDLLKPTSGADISQAAANPSANPFFNWFSKEITTKLEIGSYTHVGFSVNYLGQALTAAAMAGFVRGSDRSMGIIWGGGLVSSWLSRAGFENPLPGVVDRFVRGPGERALMAFLRIPERSTIKYDFTGFPVKNYLSPGFVLPVSLAAGCFWSKCSFCPETAERSGYRPIPPSDAVDLLGAMTSQHGPAMVHLLDNAVSPTVLAEIAKRGIAFPWYGFTRFESAFTDKDFCLALAKAGCRMLQLGLESGDQTVLDSLGKGISLIDASLILRNLHEVGIGTYVYLLFGTPVENLESAKRTLAFVAKNANAIDFLNLAIFNLPIEAAESSGLETFPFSEGDLSLYLDFRHPLGWDRKAVRSFLDREFRRHPSVSPILKRDPPAFTSSHAPFFLCQFR